MRARPCIFDCDYSHFSTVIQIIINRSRFTFPGEVTRHDKTKCVILFLYFYIFLKTYCSILSVNCFAFIFYLLSMFTPTDDSLVNNQNASEITEAISNLFYVADNKYHG